MMIIARAIEIPGIKTKCLVSGVGGDRPIAAMTLIVDPEELERFLLAENSQFNRILEKWRRSLQEEGGIKQDDFWQLVEELPINNRDRSGRSPIMVY